MKPIKLVIKGLNSFIEEQTIDFEKLTDRGLFGIFGPTGSGKSTILDGITLALYGDIARKSSNFINTNCNDLNVSYTFQISGTPNRVYVVTRHFRRDKNTGNAKTHSVMVKEITGGEEKVLAESVTAVNKTCREILGLSLEDFTRTVVLPQGRFSEFLKLEGKQRREMLERLFNLQEYGDRLAIKLNKEKAKETAEASKLEGELNSYEGISDEKLNEEKVRLGQVTSLLEKVKTKQGEVEERYKQGEEIWKMQNELAVYKSKQSELEVRSEEIDLKAQKVQRAESAAKVYPFLETYERTQKELIDGKAEKTRLDNRSKELELVKQEVEKAYEIANNEKNELLPELKDKKGKLEEAVEESARLEEVEGFLVKVEAGLRQVVREVEDNSAKEKQLTLSIENTSKEILELQKEESSLRVDEKVRTRIQEGLRLSQLYIVENQKLTKNQADLKESLEIRKNEEVEAEKLTQALTSKQEEIKQARLLQNEHLNKVPITREELTEKQGKLVEAKEKYARFESLNSEFKECEIRQKSLDTEVNKLVNETNIKKQNLEKVTAEVEAARIENIAHFLRVKLQEGMPCPVCGSTSHHVEDFEVSNDENLTKLEEQQKQVEQEYKAAEEALTKLQTSKEIEVANFNRIKDEIAFITDYFKEESISQKEENFSKLSIALTQYEEKKEELEKRLVTLSEEKLKLEAERGQHTTKLGENQKQIIKLEAEVKENTDSVEKLQQQLENLMAEVDTKDFNSMSQEILQKDKKRDELLKQITQKTEQKEKIAKERDDIKQYLDNRRMKLASGITKFDETQKKKQELLMSIGSRLTNILKLQDHSYVYLKHNFDQTITFLKSQVGLNEVLKGKRQYISILKAENVEKEAISVGGIQEGEISQETLDKWFIDYPLLESSLVNLKQYLVNMVSSMQQAISEIEDKFVKAEAKKEEVTVEYENISKQLVEIKTKTAECEKRLRSEAEQLEKQLGEENLTEEETKLYLLSKEEIEQLKKVIQEYKDEKAKLIGSIEAIIGKLNGRKLDEEQWRVLQEEKQQMTEQVENVTKDHTNLTTLVKQIEVALIKMGELREKQQKIDHKLGILNDLDKLFKGKRFVEFVAITRLKYISIEASKKLKEITNGIYGLEVDEDGKFIIRDYKNGGAQRDASTLSGGETFLASLALALALSAEIQLKGTAPLELFFLDEGFGTLDDELLEVVMSALERIHHDKLKVGIISHVEAIKNRVPVKLILTPAESGKGGTKVKLERS